MTDTAPAPLFFDASPEAACVAAPVAASAAASGAVLGRMRPERVEVVLSSDRRRAHAPELRARLVAEMMAGGVVSAVSRREGICASVLHRWLRRARADLRAAGVRARAPVRSAVQRLLPVRVALPPVADPPAGAAGLGFAAGPLAAVLEVVLRNGRVLRVPPGADPALVARMATVLE